jgi:O-antigen/teichoic acid export membrane protein
MSLGTLAAAAAVLLFTRSLTAFAAVQAAGTGIAFLAALRILARRFGARPIESFSWPEALGFLKSGIPFTAYGLLLVLYVQTNTLLLSAMKGDEATGLYTAGFRFVSAAGLLAAGVTGALFPALSRLSSPGDEARLRATFTRGMRLLLTLGGAVSLTLFVFAPELIRLFYGGAFGPSVPLLRVMAFSVVLSFANGAAAGLLMAVNQERRSLLLLGICVLFVLAINAALLPRWGAAGASWTTLLPEILYLSLQIAALRRVRKDIPLPGLLARAGAACAATVLATLAFSSWPLAARAPLFAACGAAAAVAAGLVTREDLGFLTGRRREAAAGA